uniref:Uncharacterized protein n=1 Tax=viral metagenome TaxID=1070528 RepID=A0A6C0J9U5_9ZZZZ
MENKEQASIDWFNALNTTKGKAQHDKLVLEAERIKEEIESRKKKTKKGPTNPVGGRRTRKRKIRKKRKTKRKKTKTKRKRRKTKSRKRRKYK